MQTTCRLATTLLSTALCALGACSSGGGGGGEPAPIGPQVAASVPSGSGQIAIQMAGTWEVRDATVVDGNSTTMVPPGEGTVFVLESNRLQSIGGLSVAPGFLELLVGPLTTYINILDGSTLIYGLTVDTRASGGTREEVGVAGGAIDDNTISVEAYTSSQSATNIEASYLVARYLLVRISGSVPAPVQLETEEPLSPEETELLRARWWALFGRN